MQHGPIVAIYTMRSVATQHVGLISGYPACPRVSVVQVQWTRVQEGGVQWWQVQGRSAVCRFPVSSPHLHTGAGRHHLQGT